MQMMMIQLTCANAPNERKISLAAAVPVPAHSPHGSGSFAGFRFCARRRIEFGAAMQVALNPRLRSTL